ncbi:MAG: DUF1343 domain-containing protein [Filifactoraceae bacterium]
MRYYKRILSLALIFSFTNININFANNDLTYIFNDLSQVLSTYEQSKTPIKSEQVILGNERIFTDHSYLIDGKKVGLITNQTGVNSKLEKTSEKLISYKKSKLVAFYSPEHGLDGTATAGKYISSYTDAKTGLPVYSLYGSTREPSSQMLEGIDVLLFDMQDIGSRTYTYISTLNYAMKAAAKNGIPIVVLDRPNPLGGTIVDGYVAKDKYLTFVGVDNLPIQHGMTVGELAKFFNRKINATLEVVPMSNYNRSMIWQDTGLPFIQTSPNIPNITSAFAYIATGMGDGTGFSQGDKFTWAGMDGLDSQILAEKMNEHNLSGVNFTPETKGSKGGVRLNITNYKTFNPTKTCIYLLTTANSIKPLTIPVENKGVIPMFEKHFGTNSFGLALKSGKTAEQVINDYTPELDIFKLERVKYLIYS